MDSEIKNKLNKKYNLSEKDIELISLRVNELNKAIKDVLEFEDKNKLDNNPLQMKHD